MEFLYSDSHDEMSNKNELLNEAFSKMGLHELFAEQKNWYLSCNHINQIIYSKIGNEIDSFDINIHKDKIYVSVPIKNSNFSFKTSFNDYSSAFNFIEQRFYDFND